MSNLIHYHRLENGSDIYLYNEKDTLRYVNLSIRKLDNDYDNNTLINHIDLFLSEGEVRDMVNKLNAWLKGDLEK